jgi:type IV secretion system protein VirB5
MKYPRILILAALLGAAAGAHAQIPVTDVAMNIQTKLAWTKQAVDMVNQIRTMKSQLDQAKATFDSLNGSRGMSNLLNNPMLYNYLPPDVAAAMRATGGRLAGADAIKANLKLFSIEETTLDPNGILAKNFNTRQDSNASYQMLNEQGYQAASDRIRQLEALTKSIDGARDPAAINALSVRVAAEQGMIANEQARLAVLASMAANAERVREQQDREIVMKASRGPMPVGW